MKKLILTIGLVVAIAGAANAQGLIKINNTSTSYTVSTNGGPAITLQGLGRTPNGAGGINQYYYALLVGTASTSLTAETFNSGLTLTATNYTISAGGIISQPVTGSGFAADNWAYGTSQFIQLVGWSATLGSTWGSVANEIANGTWSASVLNVGGYYLGHSNIGSILSSSSGTVTAPSIFVPGGISAGFDLNYVPIPEPSTMVLAGLGGLSLLLFRRRK